MDKSEAGLILKDINMLAEGNSVVVIKNLPVTGSAQPVKGDTMVKNIRLTAGDYSIDCKIDGFGSMVLN